MRCVQPADQPATTTHEPFQECLTDVAFLKSKLDSAFQLQEHLAALHYHHTAHNTQPITRETAALLATPPPSIDKNLWLYELCRFLIAQCNSLIVGFLFDTPACSAITCPEMRASEWQFLCAVHDQPKSCCAIDYCCHTLDWAANVVTNPKLFPSRFVALSGGDGGGPDRNAAVKNLVNVFRRLHRIFAHAWFQHRGVFWSVEGQTGLYVFFKTVCDMYDTLPAENYKLPPEAEGLESASAAAENMDRGAKREHSMIPTPTIQHRSEDDNFLPPGRTNTRRHIRSSPSTGSAVTTVMEADEDDGTDVTTRLREMRISAPETVEEEPEVAEVPVIVEQGVIDEHWPERDAQSQTPTVRSDINPEEATTTTEHESKVETSETTESEVEAEEASQSESIVTEVLVDAQDSGQDEAPKEGDDSIPEESSEHSSTNPDSDTTTTSTHDFANDVGEDTSSKNGEETVPEAREMEASEANKAEEGQRVAS